MQPLADRIAVVRNTHPQRLHSREEAIQVVFQTKETALPYMRDIVGRIGMQKTPVQDRQTGFRHRHHLVLDQRDTRAWARIHHRLSRGVFSIYLSDCIGTVSGPSSAAIRWPS